MNVSVSNYRCFYILVERITKARVHCTVSDIAYLKIEIYFNTYKMRVVITLAGTGTYSAYTTNTT